MDVTTDMLPIPAEESSVTRSSGGGGRVELFLDALPLSLGPHESIELTRFLELSDLGETAVVGSVSLDCQEIAPYTNRWHGPVASAPLTLTVVPAADERPLLEAKVERLFELCRREYNRNSNWGDYTRLYELGPEGIPLIVDTLKACDEVKFRRRMGRGLAAMATADALPYFGQLLAGDMKDDWEMVLDGLATMIEKSRSAEEAVVLLLKAMSHPDLGIRGQAAIRLRRVYDPRVAAAMREQLHREGSAARTAAMYLAAAEWLDLAEWLALAAEEPTEERVRAITPVIEKIQARWKLALPVPPQNQWGGDLLNNPDLLAEYRTVLGAWKQWARENPRTSAKFFDDERTGWPERPPAPDAEQRPAGRSDEGS